MKPIRQSLLWAIFLLLAGIFLLAKNLGLYGAWGDAIWGGLFAVVGLGFVVWFAFGRERWWRGIAGFTLLSIGMMILLEGGMVLLNWRPVELGAWTNAVVPLGIALGFWVVLLTNRENWWALIPAGVLTLLGVLIGLGPHLSESAWLALFLLGLGLVFALLYLVRFGQEDTRWAAIPAAALLLLGLATLVRAVTSEPIVVQWWPVLLLVGGVVLLVGSIVFRRAPAPGPQMVKPDYDAIRPAPGASVTENLPQVTATPPRRVAEPAEQGPKSVPQAGEKPIDIYEVLAKQPPEPTGEEKPLGGPDTPKSS